MSHEFRVVSAREAGAMARARKTDEDIQDLAYTVQLQAERIAAVLALHNGVEQNVEWFDSPTGRAKVCPTCRPAAPTDWHPEQGQAGIRPPGFVASYILAPCPTARALGVTE